MAFAYLENVKIFLAFILSTNLVISFAQFPPELQGKYCETRYGRNSCCSGRKDECSVPILDTLCYCDDFCNRTRSSDCCPDYRPYCKGVVETIIERKCVDQGHTYYDREIVKNNCNECKCQEVNGVMKLSCEEHQCLVDEGILRKVNENYRFYGWRASNYSSFWGRKYDEGRLKRLGTFHSQQKVLQMLPIRYPVNAATLPLSFDARVEWPGRISLPNDQGWCGASWAFSTVSVISDRFAIMTHGDDHTILSPQHLLSCNKRSQKGCEGGYLTKAWMFIRRYGLVAEDCYPWEGILGECRIPTNEKSVEAYCPHTSRATKTKNELHRVGPAYRLDSQLDIMYEILHSGPVQAVIKVSRDFFSYKEGIYRCVELSNSDQDDHHAVRIIGWGEEYQNNKLIKYWIVSNSWGTWWGENGFFRIRRGTNECSIEEFVIGAWIKKDRLNSTNTKKISKFNNFIN